MASKLRVDFSSICRAYGWRAEVFLFAAKMTDFFLGQMLSAGV
jgi:hypothetical protein